jgi:hypothetical protein
VTVVPHVVKQAVRAGEGGVGAPMFSRCSTKARIRRQFARIVSTAPGSGTDLIPDGAGIETPANKKSVKPRCGSRNAAPAAEWAFLQFSTRSNVISSESCRAYAVCDSGTSVISAARIQL